MAGRVISAGRGRSKRTLVVRKAGQQTVLIVDDHPLIREGVKLLLEQLRGWQVIGDVATAREALALVSAQKPDVVVLDLALPGMDGVIATREIRRRSAETRVLILSAHDELAE